jgi:hypothetical protein
MKQYDFMMGSKGACTPLRYHTAYRTFLVVRGGGGFEGDGNLVVRMTPWKSRKRLEWIRDDIGMETVSSMAAFGGRKDQLEDWSKVRFLEFIVPEGQVLSIPPYWWYSIRFPGPRVFAYSFTYWTAMNWLANADIWARYVWICHSGSGDVGGESRKIISITPPLEESESVMPKVVECKVCDVSETAAAAAEALELEIKEEYAQKEDPVFQSLVIPTLCVFGWWGWGMDWGLRLNSYMNEKNDLAGAGSGAAKLAVGSSISLDKSTERRTVLH